MRDAANLSSTTQARRRCIAIGGSAKVAAANTLTNEFAQMQQMMKKFGKMQKMMGRMGGKMPGMR